MRLRFCRYQQRWRYTVYDGTAQRVVVVHTVSIKLSSLSLCCWLFVCWSPSLYISLALYFCAPLCLHPCLSDCPLYLSVSLSLSLSLSLSSLSLFLWLWVPLTLFLFPPSLSLTHSLDLSLSSCLCPCLALHLSLCFCWNSLK